MDITTINKNQASKSSSVVSSSAGEIKQGIEGTKPRSTKRRQVCNRRAN